MFSKYLSDLPVFDAVFDTVTVASLEIPKKLFATVDLSAEINHKSKC